MTTLTLRNISKSYGNADVLHDVNFDVEDGELIVIVGPSGCGKSSLLRMVAGLEEITSGEILINDRVVNHVEPKDRDIAMVFQNYALYPHMSVYKNMAYGLKLRGLPASEIKVRVTATAELLGLEALLERKPAALSGGQRQRVAMGRAIVREPALFLFDEPLSNLDAKLRVRMRLEIKALQQRLGVTSLYVTHDQVEAMTLADRLIVLNEGRIEQIDTPLNIYQRPASIYVAGFIGTPGMNLLEGTLIAGGEGDGDEVKISEQLSITLPYNQLARRESDHVTLGIRPDQVSLSSEQHADLFCRVMAVETLGSETLAHCVLIQGLAGEELPIKVHENAGDQLFVVKLAGSHFPQVQDILSLSVNTQEIHLFETISGLRIN
ncbi:MAG: sn-glycerol 3-phosphate transport system ATP-binding protein [Candidatus Azotimanducaceae bacterium]|jgi:sn-glycerol 3-phosphate transport system ATP-binding protein